MTQSKKNIWYISKYLNLPENGNFPGRGFSLLREFSKKDLDCTLFVARHEMNFFKKNNIPSVETVYIHGVRVIKLNIIKYKKTKSFLRILGWLQFEIKLFLLKKNTLPKPDVIISSSLSILSILNGIFFKWIFSSKLIFEVRDIWPLVIIENGGFSKYNPFVLLLSFVEWLGYKYSDEIVGTMPNLKEHVQNILGKDKNVTCIPMGISNELESQKILPLPEKLNDAFPDDKFILTYAGSIGIDNALETFFKSAESLVSDDKIVFRIAGKGDLLDFYKKKFNHLKNIQFIGNLESKYVQTILRKSDCLYFAAHPTKVLKYGQSLNKLIDYMFSGKIIIASFSGYESMLNESGCGYFVPAGDEIKLAQKIKEISNKSLFELNEIGNKGKDWILSNRKYDLLAEEYLNLIL